MRPPPPPPPWGIGRDLTFIKANCPWLGVNNRSNVYTTWSDKRSNACPTMVKCVVSNNIHASNPHLIPTSPQGRGVSRNNDRCIIALRTLYRYFAILPAFGGVSWDGHCLVVCFSPIILLCHKPQYLFQLRVSKKCKCISVMVPNYSLIN